MTNITYLSAVRYAVENGNLPAEYAEKLTALGDQLEKRAHAIRKPTKTQVAAAEARESIPEYMEPGVLYSATDIGKMFGQSSQWASTKLSALVDEGRVVKTTEKRKTYYSLAE